MNRLLTSGAPSPLSTLPRVSRSGDPRHAAFESALPAYIAHWTPEALLVSLLGDLWDLAWTRQELAARLARLGAQLDDPALRAHPKRDEALARHGRWRVALVRIDETATRIRSQLAKAWDTLPPGVKARQREQPEWDGATSGSAAAMAAWAYVRRQRQGPGDDCPFVLLGVAAMSLVLSAVTT